MVADSTGTRWLHRDIDLEPGIGPVLLELDQASVVGTVRLGSQPLEADVIFGGRRGAVRIPFRTNADGEFEGALPEQEQWEVLVRADEPMVERTFVGIEPKVGPSGRKEVHLVLPDTALIVTVRDEQGKPLRALVNAQSIDDPERIVQGWTDEQDGRLNLHGLPAGAAAVIAQAHDRGSPQVEVRLNERDPTRVQLVLRANTTIKGRVVSPEGEGVPMARVVAHPSDVTPLWPVPTVLADRDGRFELDHIPSGTRALALDVGARGFVLKKVRVAVSHERVVDVVLERWGGSIVLELESSRGWNAKIPAPYVLFGGSYWTIFDLKEWSAANAEEVPAVRASVPGERETLRVPQMAPGFYRLCVASLGQRVRFEAGTFASKSCSAGALVPGGILHLRDPRLNAR
jgi:hypothetical protein